MAAARKQAKSSSISKSAIDQVGSFLQDLSVKPKQEMSIREAIDQLRDPIQEALAKGYNYEDIVAILVEQGIPTTATTVKRYVSLGRGRSRKKTAGSKPRGRRPRSQSVELANEEAGTPVEPPKATRGRRKSTVESAAPAEAEPPVEQDLEQSPPKRGRGARSSTPSTARSTSTRGRKKTS
ncbi:MAG: hypothetical protein IGS38_03630 [Synechococcales cyanobacterium M58_A2018_015]|nr:hypothetical protein [Synechococcales cyanobacterium M58_A2018_015]